MAEKSRAFGVISVNKPTGVMSTAVVNGVKRLAGVPCGHLGTLDPLATGVLPVAVGNATRLFDTFLKKKKEYIAEFTFGLSSDTLDSTGTIERGGRVPSEDEIRLALPSLCGKVMQVPPKYSAKNVGGKRGYDLARAGVEFTLAPKEVEIFSIELLGKSDNENAYRFRIVCGAGTYIRSIARDLADKIGTNALMSALTRTKSGAFTIENSVPFDELTEETLEKFLIPTENLLPYEKLTFPETDNVFCGVRKATEKPDGLYRVYRGNAFYGVAEAENGTVKVKTKLC